MRGVLYLALLGAATSGHAEPARAGKVAAGPCAGPEVVSRYYRDTSRLLHPGYAITLRGTPSQVMRLSRWLDQIYAVPYGRDTLTAIMDSGNELTICHSTWALPSAGRTLAPVSRNLTNGRGEDVQILFDVRIPASGSHHVFDTGRKAIPYSAIHNLYHELAHARHLTRGTWRYFDSEGQAIAEENTFRRQLAQHQGTAEPELRAWVSGEQVWWPE